jgi:hypothetical protein
MNVDNVQQALDDYGDHLEVLVMTPDGTLHAVQSVEPGTTADGFPAAVVVT